MAWLAAGAICAACAPNPWAEEKPFTADIQLNRGGVRVAAADLPGGADGLRLVHRVDVYRPLDFTPRGHQITNGCSASDADNGPAPASNLCSDLRVADDGAFLGADDLRPAPAGEAAQQHRVVALLTARGAVLEVANGSRPRAPTLENELDATKSLVAAVTFSGEDRYWAKYWAKCRGCLGLVWIEAQLGGQSWCPTPTPGVASGADTMALTLDLDQPPAARVPLGASGADASPCGDRSWFEAIYRLDDGDDPRPEHVVRFRP